MLLGLTLRTIGMIGGASASALLTQNVGGAAQIAAVAVVRQRQHGPLAASHAGVVAAVENAQAASPSPAPSSSASPAGPPRSSARPGCSVETACL